MILYEDMKPIEHCASSSMQCRIKIVANIAIATGPALLGPRVNFFFIICKGGY